MSNVSASQADKIRDCERKWAFDWQSDEPYVQSPEAAIGQDVHDTAQDYHDRGKFPDRETLPGAIFLSGIEFIPKPLVGRAEGEFYATISGVDYRGYIDLSCLASDLPKFLGGIPSWHGVPLDQIPAVLDYKTKANFRKAFTGAGDFLNDPQALLYALKRLIETKANYVALRWIYLRRLEKLTHKPKAQVADAILSREEVIEAFGRIVHPLSRRLIQLKAEKPDPLTLTPNPATCMKYGAKHPCKHIAKCNLDPLDILSAGVEESMGILEELESQFGEAAAKPQAAPAAAPAPAQAKGVNPPEGKVMMPKDAIKAETAPAQAAPQGMPNHQQIGFAVETLLRLVRHIWA